MKRTLAEIGRAYDDKRARIIAKIRDGEMSRSMSGIEHYPKPWAELDMSDTSDQWIIKTNLTWDGQKHSPNW